MFLPFFQKLLSAFLYGIVEGITEWLPISSTGHMILLSEFVVVPVSQSFDEAFLTVIQLGAVLAIPILQKDRIIKTFDRKNKAENILLLRNLALASLPAALFGLAFDETIDTFLSSASVISAMLLFWGIAFLLVEITLKKSKRELSVTSPESLSAGASLAVGCFQAMALVPGTSRSGATILGGMLVGAKRKCAGEFSFLLALPVMLGASGLKLVKFVCENGLPMPIDCFYLAVAAITAFFTSLAVINFLTSFLAKHSLIPFAVYRILLAAVLFIFRN